VGCPNCLLDGLAGVRTGGLTRCPGVSQGHNALSARHHARKRREGNASPDSSPVRFTDQCSDHLSQCPWILVVNQCFRTARPNPARMNAATIHNARIVLSGVCLHMYCDRCPFPLVPMHVRKLKVHRINQHQLHFLFPSLAHGVTPEHVSSNCYLLTIRSQPWRRYNYSQTDVVGPRHRHKGSKPQSATKKDVVMVWRTKIK
jgi:hypothetical protein